MINLTQEEIKKLEYLSTLFKASSVDELKAQSESEEIVTKLKGITAINADIFNSLLNEHNAQEVKIMGLHSDIAVLKNDLTNLIRAVNKSYMHPTPHELENLKSKYSAY